MRTGTPGSSLYSNGGIFAFPLPFNSPSLARMLQTQCCGPSSTPSPPHAPFPSPSCQEMGGVSLNKSTWRRKIARPWRPPFRYIHNTGRRSGTCRNRRHEVPRYPFRFVIRPMVTTVQLLEGLRRGGTNFGCRTLPFPKIHQKWI